MTVSLPIFLKRRIRTAAAVSAVACALLLSACTTTDTVRRPAAEPVSVRLAGVSFTGNYADRKLNYPHCLSLAKNGALDRAFAEELARHRYENVVLKTDLGSTNKSADAVAVSLGINLETISTSRVADVGWKTVADIYAELFFFDFDTKKIIMTLPVNMQYITVSLAKPDKAAEKAMFENMIYGRGDVKKSLLQIAAEKLASAEVRQQYGARFKVESVTTGEKAARELKSLGIRTQQFETAAAQMLTRSLVDRLHAAVVPYTKGEAIGAKMPARFANGDAFMFELPNADYAFRLNVKKFLAKKDETGPVDVDAYYVFLNLLFEQPDLGKVYLDRNFAASATATLAKGQINNLSAAYPETLFNFFEGFAQNLADPDADWVKAVVHPDNVDRTLEQLREIRDLIESKR